MSYIWRRNTFLYIAWSRTLYGTYIKMEKSWDFWVAFLILGQKFLKFQVTIVPKKPNQIEHVTPFSYCP